MSGRRLESRSAAHRTDPHGLTSLRAAACEAWIYGLPLVEIGVTRRQALDDGASLNNFTHVRRLADHRARVVTTPNNDTLYSSAQIDLSSGPVTLTLPPSQDRYLSLTLMDAYTNNFLVLGARTIGPEGGTFQLAGPTDAVERPGVIRSPTNHVWALARILVDGPEDLGAARAIQNAVEIHGPEALPAPRVASRYANWQDYFAGVSTLMAINPPPVRDTALLRRIAPLGLISGRFDPQAFSPEQAQAIAGGVDEARTIVAGGPFGALSDGWTYPHPELGDFGENYPYRAIVALGGLGALPPAEAIYMQAVGDGGPVFDGRRDWRLHFPAGRRPPVDGFWSLSLYEATPEAQYFFAENPLNRFAIGDRTRGLATNPDGSLDIWIGRQPPAQPNNWLPSPAGPFGLILRAYLPQRPILDGAWRLAPLMPV